MNSPCLLPLPFRRGAGRGEGSVLSVPATPFNAGEDVRSVVSGVKATNASTSERTSPPRASIGGRIERHLVARITLTEHARGGLVRSDAVHWRMVAWSCS